MVYWNAQDKGAWIFREADTLSGAQLEVCLSHHKRDLSDRKEIAPKRVLKVPRRFLCCSSSPFVWRWFHVRSLFV